MLKYLVLMVAALVLLAPTALADEPLILKTGEVLLGEVKKVDAESVQFLARVPAVKEMRILRKDISPSSLWRILSVRVPKNDAKARLEMGRWAEARGLLAPALVEYRRASEDEEYRVEALAAASAVEVKLAALLFDEGEEKLALRDFAVARQYYALLLERFPGSPLVERSTKRIKEIDAELLAGRNSGGDGAGTPRILSSWRNLLERATKHAKQAVKYEQGAVHGSTAGKQIRSLKRAAQVLEKAWDELDSAGSTPKDATAEEAAYATALTESTKSRLVKAYLDIGTAYLLRRSLGQADEYCAKACRLDSQNKQSHDLHKLLIEARLTSQWGGTSLGRVGRSGR